MDEKELREKLKRRKWPERNIDVYVRDRVKCQYCGLDGLENFDNFNALTMDHVIPLKLNGEDTIDNIVVSCWRCNTLKRSELPEDIKNPRELSKDILISKIKNWLTKRKEMDRSAFEDLRIYFKQSN